MSVAQLDSEIQKEILEVLEEGRANPGYIAEKTGYENSNIVNKLKNLVELGLVRKVHRGLYEKEGEAIHNDPLRHEDPGSFFQCKIETEDGFEKKLTIVDENHAAWEISRDDFVRRARDEDSNPIGDLPDSVDEGDEDRMYRVG